MDSRSKRILELKNVAICSVWKRWRALHFSFLTSLPHFAFLFDNPSMEETNASTSCTIHSLSDHCSSSSAPYKRDAYYVSCPRWKWSSVTKRCSPSQNDSPRQNGHEVDVLRIPFLFYLVIAQRGKLFGVLWHSSRQPGCCRFRRCRTVCRKRHCHIHNPYPCKSSSPLYHSFRRIVLTLWTRRVYPEKRLRRDSNRLPHLTSLALQPKLLVQSHL